MSIQSAVSAAMINDDIIAVAVMGRREDDRSSLRCNNRRAINATAGNMGRCITITKTIDMATSMAILAIFALFVF